MSSSYEIGNIVFILSNKNKIVPGVILEEIRIKTIKEQRTTYKIGIGPEGNQKVYNLDQLEGQCFSTLNEVKTKLLEQLSNYVENICEEAETLTTKWYGSFETEKEPSVQEVKGTEKINPETLLPPAKEIETSKNSTKPVSSVEELRKKFREVLVPTEDTVDNAEQPL